MSGSPESRIKEFVELMDDSDARWSSDMFHPDSPLGNVPDADFFEHVSSGTADVTYTAKTVECLEQTNEKATVRLVMSAEGVGFGEQLDGKGESTWELRNADGEWKVWDIS